MHDILEIVGRKLVEYTEKYCLIDIMSLLTLSNSDWMEPS